MGTDYNKFYNQLANQYKKPKSNRAGLEKSLFSGESNRRFWRKKSD